MDIGNAVSAVALAAQVKRVTGNLTDGAAASAYAMWVESITATLPSVVDVGGRVKIVMSEAQVRKMQDWIQQATLRGMLDKTPKPVTYEFGPVINPLLMRVVVPAGIACVIAGWLLRGVFD